MGTRSLTFVYNENKQPLVCMYRQFDGYPSGHGKELAEFLTPITMINGIGNEVMGTSANGVECLAAQMVKSFKKEIGGIYLMVPVLGLDHGQEYEYHIHPNGGVLKVEVREGENLVFEGHPQQLLTFCTFVEQAGDGDESTF